MAMRDLTNRVFGGAMAGGGSAPGRRSFLAGSGWRALTGAGVAFGLALLGTPQGAAGASAPAAALAERASSATNTAGLRAKLKPAAPFRVGFGPISRVAAARFLAQATFGPASDAEIDRLMKIGYEAWFDEQFDKPRFDYWKWAMTDQVWEAEANFVASAFWTAAVRGEDQLRARMVWALSQIFVVSGRVAGLGPFLVGYHDVLAENAFGNYRTLIDQVTYAPAMAHMLTYYYNDKEDSKTGSVPDQNYAREIMQLFSIGLWELNQDGTQKLVGGKPVPTYTQDDVIGLSKVFTGFANYDDSGTDRYQPAPTSGSYFGYPADNIRNVKPLNMKNGMHSKSEKRFLGMTIPANGADGRAEVKKALDRIASHPNVAPFLSRQLIQRFVTSNPSPAYVARVAAVWNQNDKGQRGDLKAVIKAILLDPEARDPKKAAAPTFGKVREPVIRAAHMMRTLKAKSNGPGIWMHDSEHENCLVYQGIEVTIGGQDPFLSPTVFNFYRPGFSPPNSAIAARNLVAPEFQIMSNETITRWSQFVFNAMSLDGTGMSNNGATGGGCWNPANRFDYSELTGAAADPQKLVDKLALLFTSGSMPVDRRKLVVQAVKAAKADSPGEVLKARIRVAMSLMLVTPEAMVQR